MQNTRLIALNAKNGAFVNVLASIVVKAFEFMEDESVAVQGLIFKSPMDKPIAFTNLYTVSFGSESIQIPNFETMSHFRVTIGLPVQWTSGAFNYRAADQIFSATSNGVAGTTIRFIEYA